MRVLVYGGRDYLNKYRVYAELDRLHAEQEITCIIEGEAPGADRLAKQWGLNNGVKVDGYPAHWDDLQAEVVCARKREDGTWFNAAAGNNRNLRMMAKGRPDVALEFPGGGGTANMRRIVKNEQKRRSLTHIQITETSKDTGHGQRANEPDCR